MVVTLNDQEAGMPRVSIPCRLTHSRMLLSINLQIKVRLTQIVPDQALGNRSTLRMETKFSNNPLHHRRQAPTVVVKERHLPWEGTNHPLAIL